MTELQPFKTPLMDKQLDGTDGGRARVSSVWDMDESTAANVRNSWKDDKRASRCHLAKYILVAAVVVSYLVFQLKDLNDESRNSVTRSTTQTVEEYPMPYIQFYPMPEQKNLKFGVLTVYSNLGDRYGNYALEYNITRNDTQEFIIQNDEATDISYGPEVTSWQLYYYSGYELNLTLLVPPYGLTLRPDQELKVQLTSFADCRDHEWVQFLEDKTSTYYKPSLKAQVLGIQQLEGTTYGIYWAAMSTQSLLQNLTYENMVLQEAEVHYMFGATITLATLRLTEVSNLWKDGGSKNFFYSTSIQSSTPAANVFFDLSADRSYCWQYRNDIFLSMDPQKRKTVITTSRVKDWLDMLSSAGGLWGPTLAGCTLVFVYLMTSKYFGVAREQGWSQNEKVKTALFLQEVGLLTDEQYREVLEHKSLNQ